MYILVHILRTTLNLIYFLPSKPYLFQLFNINVDLSNRFKDMMWSKLQETWCIQTFFGCTPKCAIFQELLSVWVWSGCVYNWLHLFTCPEVQIGSQPKWLPTAIKFQQREWKIEWSVWNLVGPFLMSYRSYLIVMGSLKQTFRHCVGFWNGFRMSFSSTCHLIFNHSGFRMCPSHLAPYLCYNSLVVKHFYSLNV